jgi:CRISPR-associated protein Csm2
MNNQRSHSNKQQNQPGRQWQPEQNHCEAPAAVIVAALSSSSLKSLRDYPIRDLVNHAQALGSGLVKQNVKTNQLRKFLDAINQLKAKLNLEGKTNITNIEIALQMLKPKLAYAAGRADKKKGEEAGIKSLEAVIAAAVDKMIQARAVQSDNDLVDFREDFERLANLIEAIIAYHKFEGGKDQ